MNEMNEQWKLEITIGEKMLSIEEKTEIYENIHILQNADDVREAFLSNREFDYSDGYLGIESEDEIADFDVPCAVWVQYDGVIVSEDTVTNWLNLQEDEELYHALTCMRKKLDEYKFTKEAGLSA